MKKMLALLLVLMLGLLLVACTDGGEEAMEFNPQNPKECYEQMMEIFAAQTEYRRVCNSKPEDETYGRISDLVFRNVGTDRQTVSGTFQDKQQKTTSTFYGEGNVLAQWVRTQKLVGTDENNHPILEDFDTINYLQKINGEPISPHERTYYVYLTTETGDKAENLMNGTVAPFIGDDATMEKTEDGYTVLTVNLLDHETQKLYNIDFPKTPYVYPSVAVYTADEEGRVISVVHKAPNGKEQMRLEYSYTGLTDEKPDWFRKDDPMSTEADLLKLIYKTEDGVTYATSEKIDSSTGETVLTVEVNAQDDQVFTTVPDVIPKEVTYTRTLGLQSLIFPEYNEKTKFSQTVGANVFFEKGARPADNTNKRDFFFEGEWTKNQFGAPTPKK